MSAWLEIGNTTLRVRSHLSGKSGASARRSIRTNNMSTSTPVNMSPSTGALVHPHEWPRLMESNNDVVPMPSATDPAISNFTFLMRSVSGNKRQAMSTPSKHRGACTIKMMRHPTAATMGAPITTPRTGAPAVVKLQKPRGRTRSSG